MLKNVEHVLYQGRMIPKDTFRAFVYNPEGEQCLARSWTEFQQLLESCAWFADKETAQLQQKMVKKKPTTKG